MASEVLEDISVRRKGNIYKYGYERRKFHRQNIFVIIRYIKDTHEVEEIALTDYISCGGINIVANTPLKEEEEVFLEVTLPGMFDVMKISGRVVHEKKICLNNGEEVYQMGVEFTSIDGADKMRLLNFLSSSTL